MKTRTLQNNQIVQELDKAVTLEVYTRCPEKYKLTDMETGEEYVGYATMGKNSWQRLDTTVL